MIRYITSWDFAMMLLKMLIVFGGLMGAFGLIPLGLSVLLGGMAITSLRLARRLPGFDWRIRPCRL